MCIRDSLFPLWCQTGFVGGAILAFFYNVGTVGLYFGSVVTTPLFGLEKSPVLIGWTQVVTSAAVSYTHLDVYKRQTFCEMR